MFWVVFYVCFQFQKFFKLRRWFRSMWMHMQRFSRRHQPIVFVHPDPQEASLESLGKCYSRRNPTIPFTYQPDERLLKWQRRCKVTLTGCWTKKPDPQAYIKRLGQVDGDPGGPSLTRRRKRSDTRENWRDRCAWGAYSWALARNCLLPARPPQPSQPTSQPWRCLILPPQPDNCTAQRNFSAFLWLNHLYAVLLTQWALSTAQTTCISIQQWAFRHNDIK